MFVLREVFNLDCDDIAEAVDKRPPAVRQIAHRARAHVAARRPRRVVSPADTRAALNAFQQAIENCDLQSLLDTPAPDVVLLTGGGGVVQAALASIVGSGGVAAVLGGISPAASLRAQHVNDYPALIIRLDGDVDTVIAVRIGGGGITGLYAVRNSAKLRIWRRRPLCVAESGR